MPNKEPLAEFMDYLITKLRDNSTYATVNSNIVIGESADLTLKHDDKFPRMEMIIKKMKDDGYIAQQMMNRTYRITVVGSIRRETDDTTDQDMWDIIGFATETKKLLYQINDDKRSGTAICSGFIQIGGFTEIDLGYELFPRVSLFVMECEAELQLTDTHSNN